MILVEAVGAQRKFVEGNLAPELAVVDAQDAVDDDGLGRGQG